MFLFSKKLVSRILKTASSLAIWSVFLGLVFNLPSLAMDEKERNGENHPGLPLTLDIDSLPNDMVDTIFSFFPVKTVARFGLVSKSFRGHSERVVLWRLHGVSSPEQYAKMFNPIYGFINEAVHQKPYMRMLILGRKTPINATIELDEKQQTILESLVVSSFQRVKSTLYPDYPITMPSVKLFLSAINDCAHQKYVNVEPKKPFLLLLKDTENQFNFIQNVYKYIIVSNSMGRHEHINRYINRNNIY